MREMKKGFTLAEVLITLGIIGVVASLTIPTLMANYKKIQYVVGLKKAYAEITEALKLMANDHGCPDNLKCTGVFNGDYKDNNALGNEFKKYFKLAKDCGTKYNADDESTKCMSDSYTNYYDQPGQSDMNLWGYYNFITADGFGISLNNDGYNCSGNWAGQDNVNMSQVCGELAIDINGLKGPNNYGRDIFYFYITNGRGPAIYPAGGSEFPLGSGEYWADPAGPSCNADNPFGWSCPGRIMEQGWQMLY